MVQKSSVERTADQRPEVVLVCCNVCLFVICYPVCVCVCVCECECVCVCVCVCVLFAISIVLLKGYDDMLVSCLLFVVRGRGGVGVGGML